MRSVFFLFSFFLFTSAFSQNEKIKVFINCRCDDDFLKQNTLFFDYVRDRTLSDIEIFVFEITNASGGRNYSFNYNGKNDFLNKFMEEEKPKRGRPRKEAVSETAIVPVDDDEACRDAQYQVWGNPTLCHGGGIPMVLRSY